MNRTLFFYLKTLVIISSEFELYDCFAFFFENKQYRFRLHRFSIFCFHIDIHIYDNVMINRTHWIYAFFPSFFIVFRHIHLRIRSLLLGAFYRKISLFRAVIEYAIERMTKPYQVYLLVEFLDRKQTHETLQWYNYIWVAIARNMVPWNFSIFNGIFMFILKKIQCVFEDFQKKPSKFKWISIVKLTLIVRLKYKIHFISISGYRFYTHISLATTCFTIKLLIVDFIIRNFKIRFFSLYHKDNERKSLFCLWYAICGNKILYLQIIMLFVEKVSSQNESNFWFWQRFFAI